MRVCVLSFFPSFFPGSTFSQKDSDSSQNDSKMALDELWWPPVMTGGQLELRGGWRLGTQFRTWHCDSGTSLPSVKKFENHWLNRFARKFSWHWSDSRNYGPAAHSGILSIFFSFKKLLWGGGRRDLDQYCMMDEGTFNTFFLCHSSNAKFVTQVLFSKANSNFSKRAFMSRNQSKALLKRII